MSQSRLPPNIAELKVGQIARTYLRGALEAGQVDSEEVILMQTKEYSKRVFHINYPLIVPTNSDFDKDRYYAKPLVVQGRTYRLCNDWYESDRPFLLKWLLERGEVRKSQLSEPTPVGAAPARSSKAKTSPNRPIKATKHGTRLPEWAIGSITPFQIPAEQASFVGYQGLKQRPAAAADTRAPARDVKNSKTQEFSPGLPGSNTDVKLAHVTLVAPAVIPEIVVVKDETEQQLRYRSKPVPRPEVTTVAEDNRKVDEDAFDDDTFLDSLLTDGQEATYKAATLSRNRVVSVPIQPNMEAGLVATQLPLDRIPTGNTAQSIVQLDQSQRTVTHRSNTGTVFYGIGTVFAGITGVSSIFLSATWWWPVALLGISALLGFQTVRRYQHTSLARQNVVPREPMLPMAANAIATNDELLTKRNELAKLAVLYEEPRYHSAGLDISLRINSIVNDLDQLLSRLQTKASSYQAALIKSEYQNILSKLIMILSPKYLKDMIDNPHYWQHPERRVKDVYATLAVVDKQLLVNIQQLNSSAELDFKVAVQSLQTITADDEFAALYSGGVG